MGAVEGKWELGVDSNRQKLLLVVEIHWKWEFQEDIDCMLYSLNICPTF